jgi:hypothetical protein
VRDGNTTRYLFISADFANFRMQYNTNWLCARSKSALISIDKHGYDVAVMTSPRRPPAALTNAHARLYLQSCTLLAISCCTGEHLPCTAMHICHSNHVVLSLQCIPASQNSLTSCSLYGLLALCREINNSKIKRLKTFRAFSN